MSSVVEDIKDLTMQEAPMYVVIAVILTSIILALTNGFVPYPTVLYAQRGHGDNL